jgi:hypothetical protein
MSFSEWSNQKRKKKQEETTSLPTVSNTSKNTVATGNKPSFSEWSNKKQETVSVDGWARSSADLIRNIQDRSKSWFDDTEYQSQYERVSDLLARADGWRKQYTGNDEAISYIESVVSALEDAKRYSADYRKRYSNWGSEEDYQAAVKQWQEYYDQWGHYADEADFESRGSAGWEKYLADQQAKQQKQQETRESESFWDKLGRWLGPTGAVDTTIPLGNAPEITHNLSKDTSYLKPNDNWTEDQKAMYGYLYDIGGEAAKYAQFTNEGNNQAENAEKIAAIEAWATQNGWAGSAATLGAIAMMPLSLADTLSALTEYNARGFVSTNATPLPGQVSNAITGAISTVLNEKSGTISEKVPVIGGKGLGDAYQLGTSIANSMLSAYTQGGLGTYMVFFGSASSSAMYDAKSRGASDAQAITLGILQGLAEAAGEALSVEHLLNAKALNGFFANVLMQAGIEASEEGVTTLLNNFSEQLVMGDKSNFNVLVSYYMTENGLSESEAKKKAWLDMANDLAFDMLGGAISGGVSSGLQTGVQTMFVNHAENKKAQRIYGSDPGALVNEALEIDPDNAFAQKMQGRLDSGKNLSGGQLNRLVQQNEKALTAQDMSSIQSAAESRLAELGETGDVSAIAAALTKQAAGEKLSSTEQKLISDSKYGQRVANELNTENIQSGDYSSEWAQKLDTNRINVDEYSRLVEAAQLPQETAEVTRDQVATEAPKAVQTAQPDTVEATADKSEVVVAKNETTTTVSEKETVPANDQQVTGKLTGKESLQVAEESTATEEPKAKTVTLEERGKNYGAQAQAMIHTYQQGQDVAKYDAAYQAAYDMGKSGVSFDYVKGSQAASYLTDTQRELAYEAGQAASDTEAQALDAKNKAAANGKTGRRKGVVKGEGVTISDLKKAVDDPRGMAYKYLSTVAEATGIDIVLYRSEAGPDGKFQGAQGRYSRSEPGTIYIDLNAGLAHINDVDELAKYAMLRTFAHEFTHFIEKWNPIQYNELRKVVFDTLTQRGENVNDLIEEKQAHNPGMSYDKASREVVAEAMTDILPDANFVQELAENHKTIFQKLLDQLKEFVDNLREYFNSLGMNPSREASALKEQVGETVKYLDSIVQLFDNVAVQAVENYQLTVAVDEATGETSVVETKAETVVEEAAPAVEETTPAVAESQEIPFDKRTLSLLKSTGRVGAVDLDGQKFVTNGYIMLPTTSTGFKYAHVELNATTMNTEVVRKTFENARTLATKAPMEGKAGTDAVYIFDIGGKKLYFKKKLFSHIDGGLLYAGQYNGGGVIKSVNEDGSIRGYLLGMKIKDESSVTDLKPSKLKSFSQKMQALIDAQSAPAAKPVESVIEHRTPEGVGEWSDIYERLKNPLHGMNKFVTGGYVFEVRLTPGVGYVGSIKQQQEGYVSTARGLEYTSDVYPNRNDAIQDIVTVARNNRLLEPAAPADTVTKAPDAVTEPPKSVTKQAESGINTPSEKLAAALLENYLTEENINRGGKALTSKELYALADEAFGGTQAEGAYNRKDAYDAMELAVNKFLLQQAAKAHRTFNGSAQSAVAAVEFMQDMLELLPTQNVRTQEMEDFQQFSTPPNIAYLAAWAANISNKDMVLEPSAGIGGLAVFAKAWGAEVAVNELSKRRLEVLRAMGFDHLFNENAEQIDNILPDSISPSVVIMNPPFSSTAGRTANNKTSNAEKHIDQALARLRDGGRLVAVLGKSMNNQDYYRYWDKLRKNFNIRANLSIDGSNYKKYGTTWGVQIVVIDKTGPQTGETITGRFTDLTEVPNVLEGIKNDRSYLEENRAASSNDSIRQPVVDGGNGQSRTGHDGNSEHSVGSVTDTERKKNRKGTDGDPGAGNRANGKTTAESGSEKTGSEDGGSVGTVGRTDPADGNGTTEPSGADKPQSELPVPQLSESAETSDDGVYATFVAPDIPVKGGKKHPAVLVESAAMAAVSMPKATYKPSLPANVVKNNLSDAQLVTVTYAGQAHEQKLPDGRRKGFFVGDGTGVGKGRQIAGIILDNFMQGRTKAVWISKNNDLFGDAIRDWTATTGRSKEEVVSHSRIKPKDRISLQEGILYSTYDTIKSEKGGNRLDQIVEWVGEDFDGVIAFDEAHNMGNLFGKKGKFGKSKGSEKARAGVELQRRLPNARIVYVSATAATEVDNLAYAERIGLWGQGTAFTTAQDFISKIGASGLAAMELVIRDMKAMGTYVARSISYNGVNYDTVEHGLDPMQTEIYNTMSRAWQKTMSNVQSALETTGGQYNSTERQKALGNFYSAMQRFYNQVLTSMSMPSVIADMRKELAAGHSCVLQIVNTNEAQQNKQLAEAKANGESLDNLDLTPREALVGYLANSFPTQMFEEYTDEDGNLRSRPVMDSAGNPVQNREAIRQRDALIAEVNQMSIPDGPLEMLFDAFGPDAVAENTGRSRRVVPRKQSDGSISRVEERRTLNHRTADVQAFQDGKKRILVFSDAGGTGKSYHADRTEKNQQLRIHYVLQPGWVASNAVQGFGRTHRSNEASAPIYKLVTTNIKGQKRFTSTIARRLDQLGALTKGQRDTGSGMFGAKDNLETDLAKDSLREFYKRLGKNQIEGIDGMKTLDRLGLKQKFTDEYGAFKLNDNLARDIGTFLNRILALEVDEQNVVFDAFISIYEMELEAAIQAGTLDTGMENVKADRIEVVDDKVIRQDKNTGASTHYIQAKTYTKPKVVTTVAEMQQRRTGFEGIYRTETGAVKAVFRIADKTTEWGAIQKQYRLVGPNQGAKTNVWGETTLKEKAQPIDKADWQKEWDAEVARVPQYNEDTMHMLTGALLPIWNSLPQEGNTKVKRLIAHDGSTYLGRVIDKDLIDGVLKGFDIGRTMEVFTAKQVMDKALDNGTRFYLTNDKVQIFRSRVSGEWRLEVVQPYNSWYLTRRYPGIMQERISYRDRYFIPVGEKGIPILEKLLADNPVRNTADDADQFQSREYLDEHIPITMGMTETERYEILKDRSISVTAKTNTDALRSIEGKIGQRAEDAILLTETDRKKLFVKIGKEFGVFKEYSNADVKLTFNFSRGNLKESVGKQRKNYSDFAKMLSCFDEIIDAAIGIEVHNRNDEGYKPDPTLKSVYVLVSAFEDGSNIVPVKLEIKEFVDKDNTLYVAIALESIKKDEVVKQGNTENGVTQNSRSSTIKIADLFSKINPSDTSFLKYVPTQFLSHSDEAEQNQQRTNTLTDREVLAMAANQVKVADLTDAEKDALNIFQQRLSKLEALQDERAEQGRLYKEQQFGPGADRKAAAETLNRMHVLDSQIQKASLEVLTVEEKAVLKRVLQKARTVVEQQERQHGQEILKRWRDRRNNADAIKKYRDRLRGDVDELTNWVLHPDNKNVVKHIPDALKNTVIPFLSSINFMSKRSLAGGNPTQADKALMEQARRLAKVMENTVDLDDMYSNYTDLPPDFMRNLRNFIDTAQEIVDSNSGDFIINQMTAEELQKLSKVVRALKKYIMTMNRFHVNSMFKHVYEAGENSIDFLAELKPAENTGAVSQFLLWQQMRPAYAFERFGDGGQAIYDGLRRGQATLAFNTKKIMEFSEKAYTTDEVKKWENEVKTIRLGPGKTVTMRVSQIMSLYELSKRKQAEGHILGDGIRVATFKNGKQKISDVGQTLTPGELNLILRELTPRQKEVADNLQQFMQNQGGEWGNYVTVARFGEKQFGEENYFPINSDGRHLSVDADEKPGAAALYALLNMGFTKQTQEKAKNRIVVYSIFDVFSNHMASMAQYNAFALPVVDALKWFNYQRVAIDDDGSKTILGSVREQMDRAFGVPEENRPGSGRRGYAQNFVINIIKALNGTEAQGTAYDSWGLQTLHHYNRAQVAYNFRVVVQQPLAITRAAQLLDYSSILKGMKLQPAAIQKNIQEMKRYSGIAAWKSLGFYDVNISRGLTSIIKHDDTAMDKITDVGMWGAEKADTLTWAAIWSAAKEEVIRKQKLTPKSEEFYEAVTKLFEEVIYKTQVVDSVLTKNEFMRDKGFWSRAVGSFMSEPTTTASMLVDAYDKYHMDMQRGMNRQQAWKKNSKNIVRTAYVYGLGAAILAAVQAVADAFRDDDDYQEWYEKWLEAFGGNLVDELMPVNKLPIVSDFYDLAKELLSILGVDTYGNPPQSVFMQWYDSLVKGVEILYDKISGEDTKYTWYGGAYKLLQAASGMTGLPMAAATRETVTAWNNIVGAMAPSLKVKTYDPGEKNEIKYAYQDGYLTAEEAIEQLIQQGVVDTEHEAYFIVEGWEAGDGYSRYDAIVEAVRNGGDFNAAMRELTSHGYTEKDILSQVKGEIGKWYKGGEITKQQAINMLTKYMDMDSEDITATVNKWSSKVVTGMAFEDIKDEFLAGNITAARAIEMRMRYGGETKEEAQTTIGEWTFEAEHPELDGIITYTQYMRWQTDGKPKGVSLDTFTNVAKFRGDGTSDSVKSQEEVAAYINSLNISTAQKDALWCCFWKKTTLKNAPWH